MLKILLFGLGLLSTAVAEEEEKLKAREDQGLAAPGAWFEKTAGMSVLIKFEWRKSPKLREEWDRLEAIWEDSDYAGVFHANCFIMGDLCQRVGVKEKEHLDSKPTIMYGDPHHLLEYKGGRTFEELKAFAEKVLVPICSIHRLHLCDDEVHGRKKELIADYMKMSKGQLKKLMKDERIRQKNYERDNGRRVIDTWYREESKKLWHERDKRKADGEEYEKNFAWYTVEVKKLAVIVKSKQKAHDAEMRKQVAASHLLQSAFDHHRRQEEL
jgi:hypothetical protein